LGWLAVTRGSVARKTGPEGDSNLSILAVSEGSCVSIANGITPELVLFGLHYFGKNPGNKEPRTTIEDIVNAILYILKFGRVILEHLLEQLALVG
jgi:hypothetical protein